jgi:WD40 repeat protein
VSGDNNATLHVYDARSGQVLDSYKFGAGSDGEQIVTTPRFSPDSRVVAAIAGINLGNPVDPGWPVRLLSADTLDPVGRQPYIPREPELRKRGVYEDDQYGVDEIRFTSLAFSADGRYLAAGVQLTQSVAGRAANDAYGMVWDLRAPDRSPRLLQLPGGPQRIALSPDGHTIYSPSPLTAYDVATGKKTWQRPELRGDISIDLTTDGDLLALQQIDPDRPDFHATTGLVDAHTGRTVRALRGPADPPRAVSFSADDRLLATAGYGGEVTIWDVATGHARERIKTSEVSWAAGFSPDARTLYTGGEEGILRVYDLAGQRNYLRRTQAIVARHYLHVLPSDDGKKTAYVWRDGQGSWVSITDTASGARTRPARLDLALAEGSRTVAAWHPDGLRLAIHDQHTIALLDARTGKVLKQSSTPDPRAMAYVDHGDRLMVGTSKGITFYDADLWPGAQNVPWTAHCCTATTLDGKTAVLFEDSPDHASEHWRIIDTDTGRIISERDPPPQPQRRGLLARRSHHLSHHSRRRDPYHRHTVRAAQAHTSDRTHRRRPARALLTRRITYRVRRRRRDRQPLGRAHPDPARYDRDLDQRPATSCLPNLHRRRRRRHNPCSRWKNLPMGHTGRPDRRLRLHNGRPQPHPRRMDPGLRYPSLREDLPLTTTKPTRCRDDRLPRPRHLRPEAIVANCAGPPPATCTTSPHAATPTVGAAGRWERLDRPLVLAADP